MKKLNLKKLIKSESSNEELNIEPIDLSKEGKIFINRKVKILTKEEQEKRKDLEDLYDLLKDESDNERSIRFEKIDYIQLNARQKENYNFHKVASALAEYGYDSMRLNNDWEGADFIAVNKDEMIKVQLKGRFTVAKKYLNKDLYIAFIEDGQVKIYRHDEVVSLLSENITSSKSWVDDGVYTWGKTPDTYEQIITKL